LWAQRVLTALAAIVAHNDMRAWTELMALPNMVLRRHARGGKGNRRRAETETKKLCRSWLEGHRGELWRKSAPVGRHKVAEVSEKVAAALGSTPLWEDTKCHDRVTMLLKEGLLQKGCSTLVSKPLAGPSGLRPQHLKDALVPGLRDEVLRHMAHVVNLLGRGEAPADVQPWLCGASLVALPKEGGDLRPVAVGDTLRRLVGKALGGR
jgi:hypothetical protein